MIVEQQNHETGALQIVVTGNRSMSWRANVLLAASLGAVSVLFGAGIAAHGFWLVLPFAGLEFLLVMVCLGIAYRQMSYTEVITLKEQTFLVESGYNSPESSVEFSRHWAQIDFFDPESAFEVGRLTVRSSGQYLELGRVLNKTEKRDLHERLQRWLGSKKTKLRLIS